MRLCWHTFLDKIVLLYVVLKASNIKILKASNIKVLKASNIKIKSTKFHLINSHTEITVLYIIRFSMSDVNKHCDLLYANALVNSTKCLKNKQACVFDKIV